jgi:hypothetical protein
MIRTDRRLYFTKNRDRVVEEGDPEGVFLYAAAGDEISDDDAKQYGIEVKAEKPADNKAVQGSENKVGGPVEHTVAEISEFVREMDAERLDEVEKAENEREDGPRKGVQDAIQRRRGQLEAEAAEGGTSE